ncbi:serine/threonine-protein phosphatase 2A regulatory subunit B'' subunit gamma-like isoform X1 [Drosophila rhopaloa]|uniref:Serine/threonine-protein phosphatase 2A regulatory subunit B'' subunit gamma n=3 Tax=Drosophila rhopaloa TaxID=1041015 RepID=A0ABM5HR31_DRORH|nr:serine/threonine-protein phosphatase 2A regulatory subunit B'' subunit gamma-like isoform X1 [Drosophila rhopaloa]
MELESNLQVSSEAFDENVSLKQCNAKDHPSYKQIPKFFDPPPKPDDKIRQPLCKNAHSIYLQSKADQLLNTDELNEMWKILEKYATETTKSNQQLIGFDDFLKVVSEVNDKCKKIMTVELFFKLLATSNCADMVEIISIYNYVMRRILLIQGLIGLSLYDEIGQGYLNEIDLECYITDIIPTLAQVSNHLHPSFERFYVCTVVKKVFFFLDHLHTRRIRIKDIVSSGLLSQLLELRDSAKSRDLVVNETGNWFSMPAVLEVYENYLDLDRDHDGMLSKKELSQYGSGSLSPIFLDRAFEVCRTYNGEMDYKTFLDFYFAMEYRKTLSAMHYIFRILDINQQGYLTAQTLRYFFDGIEEGIKAVKTVKVNFQDLKDEIFDMVRPKDPMKITLRDLINSGQGETVFSILIEFDKFLAYENREQNLQNV